MQNLEPSTKQYVIKSTNLEEGFVLIGDDYGEAVIATNPGNKYPEEWFYSQNNSCFRIAIFEFCPNTILDKYQFDAELAVFSGNLFRLILGPQQPQYYVCEIEEFEQKELKHRHARACNAVDEFYEWVNSVKVSEDKIYVFKKDYQFAEADQIPINGLTAILVAGCFLNEEDWSNGNFGLIKSSLTAIRIDPGVSFGDNFFYDDSDHIFNQLTNLLTNYIFSIENENYLFEFRKINSEDGYEEDSLDKPEALHEKVNGLFNKKDELFSTLAKIISLPISLYKAQARRDFSITNIEVANHMLIAIKKRIDCFFTASCKLIGFAEYYNKYAIENSDKYYLQLMDLQTNHFFKNDMDNAKLIEDIAIQKQLLKIKEDPNIQDNCSTSSDEPEPTPMKYYGRR